MGNGALPNGPSCRADPQLYLNVICRETAVRLKSGAKRKWLTRAQNVGGVSYFNGLPAVSGAAIVATKVIDARTIK